MICWRRRKALAFLLDVNVLLALVFEAHQHHPLVVSWITGVRECRVCRVTQSGFLRLASNSSLWKEEALTLFQAWTVYDAMMEDERFSFAHEPLGLEHLWRRLTSQEHHSPKVWTDRYLAAFAMADTLALVTLGMEGFVAFRTSRSSS
ncbi:MAG: VapC toxin family PIN domain ribonuclease [Spirochaetaceae bacterium]|nr:MAG: VapC toxin family PIN domain ribonuclease [Spirochaetaceae bacterium]